MKRLLCCLLAALLLLTGCTVPQEQPQPSSATQELPPAETAENDYALSAAVLCVGEQTPDMLFWLEQATVLNLSVERLEAAADADYTKYDIIYLDESLSQSPNLGKIADNVKSYVEGGGSVFVPNCFYDTFSADFFGAKAFEKIDYPNELTFPEVSGDLAPLQELISDYHSLYASFADAEALQKCDYGYAAVPDTAVTLAAADGLSLYLLNRYGEGRVLFSNPLLPNAYSLGSLTMLKSDDSQTAFASTTASCNQLFLSDFAAFVAKELYGFSLERVFGVYGSPSASWELHYEEITGIEHDSMRIFSELCMQEQQIPSFTLIRNTYQWFTRTESVTYALNEGGGGLQFAMDYYENAYSSGTHAACGDEFLHQYTADNAGSYFVDSPEYTNRAYPALIDYDADGIADLFCGSFDGTIYYYRGLGFTGKDGRLSFAEPIKLTDENGGELSCGSFSAPQLADLDGDGVTDLLCGGADGRIRWYRGNGTTVFSEQGVLLDCDFPGQALPYLADLNGDGTDDLLVGSDQGILLLFYGEKTDGMTAFSHWNMRSYTKLCADSGLGKWLAPCVYREKDDMAILVGTFDGYIAKLPLDADGEPRFDGYLDCEEENFKGNSHLKYGNWVVPVLADLNGDGAHDLLCGQQEYGLAYPIDSPYFALRDELQAQMDYAERNHFYVGVHFYTNAHASAEREAYELAAHRKAMASYGVDTDAAGANQHTWYTSTHSGAQSMQSIRDAGLLWQSGFGSPGASFNAPQYAAENAIALPFLLVDGGEQTMLVQNHSVLPYTDAAWYDLSGKYQMPMCVYYHCDFVYVSDTEAKNYIHSVAEFQKKYGYNFLREDQMMYASAAAFNLEVTVERTADGFTVTPSARSESGSLYNAVYQNACGIRIEFAERCGDGFSTDAKVWKRSARGLTVGLDGTVRITRSTDGDPSHLERVNLPAEISDDGTCITFLDDGMMQVAVRGEATTTQSDWTVTSYDGLTVFTKFGDADTLRIAYSEENK